MIKKIHYIWLGKKSKSKKIKECIETWKYYFPGWEIIEWNEINLDIEMVDYCREAYSKKKYAFVSDYFRFWILYNYGGLYFDTDVKVIKDFLHLISESSMFCGFESDIGVAPGLVLYSKNIKEDLFKEVMESYKDEHFVLEDGSINEKTVVVRFTNILQKYGLVLNNTKQVIKNMTIYPTEYFCPIRYSPISIFAKRNFTENTCTIHLFNGSWIPWYMKLVRIINHILKKIIYLIIDK